MAHIVSCMLDAEEEDFSLLLNNYIARTCSQSVESIHQVSATTSLEQTQQQNLWRMHQSERQYKLFPREKPTLAAATSVKALDLVQASTTTTTAQHDEKTDKSSTGSGFRIRIKDNLTRRLKFSAPESGPMKTVQETPMDSPTIPGRPPFHERLINASANSWKPHHIFDQNLYFQKEQPLEEEIAESLGDDASVESMLPGSEAEFPRPLSPKGLAPLVIPVRMSPPPHMASRLRSATPPQDAAMRSAQNDDLPTARTPFTPSTAPLSAATTAVPPSAFPAPLSARSEARASPTLWEKETRDMSNCEPIDSSGPSLGHRRYQSESGSIMERGRPRKQAETPSSGSFLKRTPSKRSISSERKAFEQLPKGWKASEAVNTLKDEEVALLQRQALQQAARFEVLRKGDVDTLSRELRQLDERCEYLRRTFTSLRAGRRNLHTRICQYLRSPRTAKFSHDSMLKQEEALADLDASIDDWVSKLEQVENRRTRVRQKLLEHVAAAATIPRWTEANDNGLLIRAAVGVGNISTPPRSPTKACFDSMPSSSSPSSSSSSPSPHRGVGNIPSINTPEQPNKSCPVEPSLTPKEPEARASSLRRAETIRIYADGDVYALLADVESRVSKMDCGSLPLTPAGISDSDRRELHRGRSHEILDSRSKLPRLSASPRNDDKVPCRPRSLPKSASDSPDSIEKLSKPASSILDYPETSFNSASSPPPHSKGNGGELLTDAVFRSS